MILKIITTFKKIFCFLIMKTECFTFLLCYDNYVHTLLNRFKYRILVIKKINLRQPKRRLWEAR